MEEQLKSIVYEKDGVRFYWHPFLDRWEKSIVRIQQWKTDEIFETVKERFKDHNVELIDSPI